MPITPRTVKDATTATANWGSAIAASAGKWAAGYANPSRNPFDANVINPDAWQAGVSTPQAKALYKKNMAGVNQDVVLATVNGPGKQKYAAAGQNKTGKVQAFMQTFLPKLGTILQNLNQTNPKGPRGTNRARLNAYLDAVEATRGTNT